MDIEFEVGTRDLRSGHCLSPVLGSFELLSWGMAPSVAVLKGDALRGDHESYYPPICGLWYGGMT